MESKENKIFIAVPTNRGLRPKMAESLVKMICATKENIEIKIATEGYTIAENRSYLVWRAIEARATHILFIDDDMVFPPETLDRLLSLNKEIVGVNSHGRKLPLQTTVTFWEKDWIDNGVDLPQRPEMPKELFEVKEVGGGVLLVDMQVFEKIDKPWFAFTSNEEGWTTQGEDGHFCMQARNKGIKIWCDPTITIGHLGEYNFSL